MTLASRSSRATRQFLTFFAFAVAFFGSQTARANEAEALRREAELGMTIYSTYDAREGPRAFAEKRAPKFEGR